MFPCKVIQSLFSFVHNSCDFPGAVVFVELAQLLEMVKNFKIKCPLLTGEE